MFFSKTLECLKLVGQFIELRFFYSSTEYEMLKQNTKQTEEY